MILSPFLKVIPFKLELTFEGKEQKITVYLSTGILTIGTTAEVAKSAFQIMSIINIGVVVLHFWIIM